MQMQAFLLRLQLHILDGNQFKYVQAAALAVTADDAVAWAVLLTWPAGAAVSGLAGPG